jgi:hypothetical protein
MTKTFDVSSWKDMTNLSRLFCHSTNFKCLTNRTVLKFFWILQLVFIVIIQDFVGVVSVQGSFLQFYNELRAVSILEKKVENLRISFWLFLF